MLWNLLLIKVLNNFWYLKHEILTRICSEAFLKHYWRNCNFCYFFQTPFLELCLNYAFEPILVKIMCLKYQKLFKNVIRSTFQGMYWSAFKTATLTSIQHTVIGGSWCCFCWHFAMLLHRSRSGLLIKFISRRYLSCTSKRYVYIFITLIN
jgi:hypothetical protein